MKAHRCTLSVAMTAFGLGSLGNSSAPASAAGLPVFDATNYAQNLLQAARALDQINNQVKSLQNEAAMLQNMAKNLQTIDFPQLQRLSSAMQQIDQLMSEAKGIQFRVEGLDKQDRGAVSTRSTSADRRPARCRCARQGSMRRARPTARR